MNVEKKKFFSEIAFSNEKPSAVRLYTDMYTRAHRHVIFFLLNICTHIDTTDVFIYEETATV